MEFAIVKGTVVSSQKVSELTGVPLKVILPCDENQKPISSEIIAADPIGARTGDLVMWVGKREASLAILDAGVKNQYPLDAAITGIIDDIS